MRFSTPEQPRLCSFALDFADQIQRSGGDLKGVGGELLDAGLRGCLGGRRKASPCASHASSTAGLLELVDELIRMATDRAIKYPLRTRIRGIRQELALTAENKSRTLNFAPHDRGIDSMQRV